MWYWLMKFQGKLLVPVFAVYYALRHIPFHIRCIICHRCLDQTYMCLGICESCQREMTSSDNYYAYMSDYRDQKIERIVYPTKLIFDAFYRRIVGRAKDGKVLDVGCGQGYILSGIKKQHTTLYGIDIQEPDIRVARNWVEGGHFCLGDIRSLPYRSNAFDYLICTEVLEHVEGDDVIKECHRVLKPGGVALITVPNGRGASGKINPTHIRLFTFKAITNLLRVSGFSEVHGQKFGLYLPFISPLLELLLRVSGRRLPISTCLDIKVPEFLATNFFLECRKSAEAGGQS